MSTLSYIPRLTRGAIISIDTQNPLQPTTAIFQYNPAELTRTLEPQTTNSSEENRAEPMRLKGPPIETIDLVAEIDATDQLDSGDALTINVGIYPQLASLELLLYPKITNVIQNTLLLSAGSLEILPTVAPLTLFVWGVQRVLPVRIIKFSITEEAHDANLNPIRAKVSLGLRVLSYEDFLVTDAGYQIFIANQAVKETMAALNKKNLLQNK